MALPCQDADLVSVNINTEQVVGGSDSKGNILWGQRMVETLECTGCHRHWLVQRRYLAPTPRD